MMTLEDVDYHVRLVTSEPDRDAQVFYARVFADMIEDAGWGEDAGLVRRLLDAGREPREVITRYRDHMCSRAYHARLAACGSDRETRAVHAGIFADMVEDAGHLEDARLIRCFLDAGREPREAIERYYRHALGRCCAWPGDSPYVEAKDGLCVSISFHRLTIRSLDILREMPYVRHLDVSLTGVRDDDLTCLDDMLGLESFIADKTRISDRTIERLSRLPNLTRLSIDSTLVTERSIDALASMRARLSLLNWWPLAHLRLYQRHDSERSS